MKDRGKAAAMENNYYHGNNNNFSDFNYSVSSDMPCMKHPNSSPVGICSYCLKDRLLNLVCSECGEQRLSSCSCSDNSTFSNRNSCSVDVGSVGRISILLENEKNTVQDQENQQEKVILLRSSSINCVEIKKNKNGFWKIKRLFKKKRGKGVDEKSDVCDGVSRSRSLCSFRNGGGFNETDDGGSDYRFSSAKISDVTGGLLFDPDEPRKSDFKYGGTGNDYRFSSAKISDVADEPRKSDFKNHSTRSGVGNRGIFRVKESDFDDSAFIDLNLDLSSSSFSGKRLSNVSDHGYDSAASMGGLRGGSCRITTVNEFDRRMKRGNNSSSSSGKNKMWKWISGAGRKSTSNRDENCDLIIKS